MITSNSEGRSFAPGSETHAVPAVMDSHEKRVTSGFWKKLVAVAGRIPFAEDAVAAYICATDSNTPVRVRGTLLAALAYFVIPTDMIPDFLAGLGFTDDAAVLAAALGLVASHLKPEHRDAARRALKIEGISTQKKSPPPEN